MKIVPIIPECFKLDGGACFGVVPKSIWSQHVPADENNMVNISSRCLLVDKGDKKVLIDTGMGNKQSEKYFKYFYLFERKGIEKALAENGYKPEDITDVILTHLHFDHVGGSVKWGTDGETPVAVFPNATYFCSKEQWDSAHDPNPREKASFHTENYQSLYDEGRLEFIFEDTSVCEGIDLEVKHGHTRGQIIPIISYNNKKVAFTADFIATVLNIPLAYVPSFDVDPVKSMEEKEEFLNRAAENGYILVFEHDYYHECCTLEKTPKGVRAGEIMRIREI